MALLWRWREHLLLLLILLSILCSCFLPAVAADHAAAASSRLHFVLYHSAIPGLILLLYFTDGLRWQLWPVLWVESIAWLRAVSADGLIRCVALALTLLLCFLFPVVCFPEPPGAYSCGVDFLSIDVGTQDEEDLIALLQSAQEDERGSLLPYIPTPSTQKNRYSIPALLFYPSDRHRHRGESRSRCFTRHHIAGLADLLRVPSFLLSYWLKFEMSAVHLVPLSKKKRKFPAVLLSHAEAMSAATLTQLATTLACSGFIVLVPDHADGSAALSDSTVSCAETLQGRRLGGLDSRVMEEDPLLVPLLRTAHKTLASAVASGPGVQDAAAFDDLLARRPGAATGATHKTSLELQLRFEQARRRAAELRAARRALQHLSGTSGGWLRERIDWCSGSIGGVGLGAAAALLVCLVDHLATIAARAATGSSTASGTSSGGGHPAEFNSLFLLAPWLDPLDPQVLGLHAAAQALGYAGEDALAAGSLPQHVLVLATEADGNQRLDVLLRTLQLLRECKGTKLIARLARSKPLDFSDLAAICPLLFKLSRVSGPRSARINSLAANRIVSTFLLQSYRHSLFSCSGRTPLSCFGGSGLSGTETEQQQPPRGSADERAKQLSRSSSSDALKTLKALECLGVERRRLLGLAAQSSRGMHHVRLLWRRVSDGRATDDGASSWSSSSRRRGGHRRASRPLDLDLHESLTDLLGSEAALGEGVKLCSL